MSNTQSTGNLYPMFSKPLYSKILDIDTKKIVSMLEEYDFRTGGNEYTLSEGIDYTISITKNLYVLDDKRFKFLKDKIMEEFYKFSRGEMKYPNKFETTTSWFTKSTKNHSGQSHNHNNCMISGILYLQTNENSGNIVFENFSNKRYKLEIDDYNLYNSTECEIRPVDGLLLMFPSEVHHMIQENKSDTTRYSLAFNLTPIGLIGNTKSDSHMTIKVEK